MPVLALANTGVVLSPEVLSEIGRILRTEDFRPCRMKRWLHSPDRDFRPKFRRICDLHLHPPENAPGRRAAPDLGSVVDEFADRVIRPGAPRLSDALEAGYIAEPTALPTLAVKRARRAGRG